MKELTGPGYTVFAQSVFPHQLSILCSLAHVVCNQEGNNEPICVHSNRCIIRQRPYSKKGVHMPSSIVCISYMKGAEMNALSRSTVMSSVARRVVLVLFQQNVFSHPKEQTLLLPFNCLTSSFCRLAFGLHTLMTALVHLHMPNNRKWECEDTTSEVTGLAVNNCQLWDVLESAGKIHTITLKTAVGYLLPVTNWRPVQGATLP